MRSLTTRATQALRALLCAVTSTLLLVTLAPLNSTAAPLPKPSPTATAPQASSTSSAASCDLERGKRVYAKCAMCHARDKSAPSPAGPNLFGVINRPAGRAAGFRYSRAMTNYGKAWTVAELDRFLTKPAATVPGTAMAFAGLAKQADRAAVICLLQQAK